MLYRDIHGAAKRRWAGEGKRFAMAFSAFGHGIYSEYCRRAAIDGEERAMAALELGAAENCTQAWQPAAGAVQFLLQGIQSRPEAAGVICSIICTVGGLTRAEHLSNRSR